ncbi:MAG: hypothetical protein E3J43_02540 [Candidatus Heimdallarchaeota archaeon]|nr:MAG: hypothetical protein E3J43_02540 [Candidatus Heimdallarchaeota archaeon]
MSEREVKYYKLLAKFYGTKEKFFDVKEDLDELEGKKVYFKRKNAEVNKELQEQLIKINKLKESGKGDKALKEEAKLKKKEVTIAENRSKIQSILMKIEKKKLEFQKVRAEMEKTEAQIKTEYSDKFTELLSE